MNNTHLILSKSQINKCIEDIVKTIIKENKFIHLICILEGAKRFSEDISISLISKDIKHHISYIKIEATCGLELLDKALIAGVDIRKYDTFKKDTLHFIVDDLIDSGKTISKAKQYLKANKYKNIKTIALLNKYKYSNIADIVGFDLSYDKQELLSQDIKDYWLFGYGMDIGGSKRELDEVRALVINDSSV